MNLTSLGVLKAWVKSTTTDDDVLLTRLITQVSGLTLNELQRPPLVRTTFTELRDGVGNQALTLRNWPVVAITSLTIDGVTIPASTSTTSSGYTLTTWDGTSAGVPQELTLRGYSFCRGQNNIQIVYEAGYCVTDAAYTVKSSTPYVVAFQPYLGSWAQDDGVTYANGTALVATTSSSPASGYYQVVLGNDGNITYTFNAADANAAVLISYSYVPAALEQLVLEWIGERYRYKDRIGQSSKSIGGNETAAYSLKGIPDYIQQGFDNYKKFLPL